MRHLLSLVLLLFPLLLSSNTHAAPSDTLSSDTALFEQQATEADLLSLSEQLSPSLQAKGEFTQHRYLKVLKKPLVSQGEFIFAKDLGIIWQQTTPFASTLILKDKRLIQIDSQGNVSINDAEQTGSGSQMSDVMPKLLNALLSGDIEQLEQHFNLSLVRAETNSADSLWQLGLQPIDPLIAKALPKMVLIGNENIQSLVLFSANGDRSEIAFSAIDERPLTPSDKARFNPTKQLKPDATVTPKADAQLTESKQP
ncbi:outer membrane lipoprotein carrier protein LolA [uncultured Shewanella sp.]|uniref:outer membrane lipoprotein carrier protein LolA n=1 Tax=uncultured Shewanella sp. TaxID=173975 RepID=UPI00261108CF|nr:outer membrane lipoprotein carrier protein LolA [uncultured Shewanella sp.]